MSLCSLASPCRVQVNILRASFLQQPQQIHQHYSAVLTHQEINFKTAVFTRKNREVDLSSTKSFIVDFAQNQENYDYQPFLKVSIMPLNSGAQFQAIVESKTLLPLIDQSRQNQQNGQTNQKYALSFPLYGTNRQIKGEVQLSFVSFMGKGSEVNAMSSYLSSSISRFTTSSERRIIYSSALDTYFQPICSPPIQVNIFEEEKPQSLKQKEKQKKSNSHQEESIQRNSIDIFESKEYLEGEEIVKDKIKAIQNENGSRMACQDLKGNQDSLGEILEEYHHLFKKITEINRKYAPLQRIPSQEELSQDLTNANRESNIQSFYSIDSEDYFDKQIDNPLVRAQSFLQELNLFKLGSRLKREEEGSKQE